MNRLELNKLGAYNTSKYNSIKPDWLRIVIPYDYDSGSVKYGQFSSRTNNPVKGVRVHGAKLESELKSIFSIITGQSIRHFNDAYQKKLVSNWQKLDSGHDFYHNELCHLNRNIDYCAIDDKGGFNRDSVMIPYYVSNMGFMIEFSGQGCREMAQLLHTYGSTWQQWFGNIKSVFPKSHCTRIDLCLDIKGGPIRDLRHLTPRSFFNDFKQRHVITNKQSVRFITGAKYHARRRTQYFEPTGDTTYVGIAPFMLRVYDKQKERYYSHGDTYRNKAKYWTRWEFENGQTYANQAFNYLANGELFSQVYLGLMDQMFRVVKDASNSRSKDLDWFSNFKHSISDMGDGCLGHDHFHGPFKNIFDSYTSTQWLNDSVSKTFVIKMMAISLMGGDVHAWIQHFLHEGKSKVFRDREGAMKRIHQIINTVEPKLRDGKPADRIFYDVMNKKNYNGSGLIENYKDSDHLGRHAY